jgi:hypothetical protein
VYHLDASHFEASAYMCNLVIGLARRVHSLGAMHVMVRSRLSIQMASIASTSSSAGANLLKSPRVYSFFVPDGFLLRVSNLSPPQPWPACERSRSSMFKVVSTPLIIIGLSFR